MKKSTYRKIEKTAKALLDVFVPHMKYKRSEYQIAQFSCEYSFITRILIITNFQDLTFKYDIINKTWTMQDVWTHDAR